MSQDSVSMRGLAWHTELWVLFPAPRKLGTIGYTCNPSNWDAEAGGSEGFQAHPGLHKTLSQRNGGKVAEEMAHKSSNFPCDMEYYFYYVEMCYICLCCMYLMM